MISKLMNIQSRLNAPKNQKNKFGGYSYRSAEDILEAVKPLLKDNGVVLTLSDSIEEIGGLIYVKRTATITDGNTSISTQAFARESLDKKGMDVSQMTGSASSYARKYRLNGLLCIDDNKDADTDEHRTEADNRAKAEPRKAVKSATKPQTKNIDKSTEQTQSKAVKGESERNVIVCEVCGQRVAPDFAEKCKARNNGHIFCSKTCKDKFKKIMED